MATKKETDPKAAARTKRAREAMLRKIQRGEADLKVTITLTEELLGSLSANPDLMEEFIASKGNNAREEVEAILNVEETLQKGTTVFARTKDDQPFIYDYHLKGFMKDACSMLTRAKDTHSSGLRAFKKEIDGLIFPEPRQILLQLPPGTELGICQRPLRASTPQGERIALARSESAPAGTKIEFLILMLKPEHIHLIEEWLSYGRYRGLGQWRNSGKGRFLYELETVSREAAVA